MTPPAWSTACPDWERRILDGRSLIPLDPLFPAEAAAALETFGELRMVDVAGQPTMGEACRPWIRDFVAAVFGAYDAETGRRLIRYFLLLVAKKNGKSTLSAGVMITALLRNWRSSGEYLIVAPTLEIAKNSFQPALDMIKADDELKDLLHPQPNLRTITHRFTGATLKVVAADSQTIGGKKTIGLLVEELWLFGKADGAKNMLREAIGGLASRPEGFVIWISTQSDEPPAGVFKETLAEFRDIRDGVRSDPRSLPVIYEFPRSYLEKAGDAPARYEDPANWRVTNPNMGASVDEQFLAEQHAKDSLGGLASLNGFFAKHLNVEVGQAQRADNWPGARHWAAAAEPGLTLESILGRCEVVTCGVDGGGLDDMLGFAALGRERLTRKWLLWTHAWCHRGVLKLRQQLAPRLLDFEKDGDLTIVDRMDDGFRQLARYCDRINRAGLLNKVGFDAVGVKLIVDALANLEIPIAEAGGQVIAIGQGYQLQGTIKAAEDRLSDGDLKHGGQNLMSWCAGNAKQEQRGNAILVTKAVSGIGKIDPLMAAFNSVALMSLNPEALGGPSIYDVRGGGFLVV
jgi:phage terminase large subunit-like protein